METLKQALKSKAVWSGIVKIVAGIGFLVTGEQTVQTVVPEILMALWGVLDIVIRFHTHEPIGHK